jgi:predicted DNA-binding protein YlxM (UPF0122 family)
MSRRKYEHLLDEWVKLHTEKKLSVPQIAEQYKASSSTIRRYLQNEGIDVTEHNGGRNKKYKHLLDEWVDLYEKENLSTTEIAGKYEASRSTVIDYLKEAGVIEGKTDPDDDQINDWAYLYEEEEMSIRQIANQSSAARSTVSSELKADGLDVKGRSAQKRKHPVNKWVRLYEEQNMSTIEIANLKNTEVSSSTVAKYLRAEGVDLSRSNRLSKELLTKRANQSGQCWEWQYKLRDDRYGVVKIDGEEHIAHRAAYRLWKGEIPDGKVVRHKCDNQSCIRPKHLELGTTKENQNDIYQVPKDLHALTQDDLRDILGREEEDWLRIAEDHDVRLATIRYILEEKEA